MLSPQDDRSTAAVQASLAGSRPTSGPRQSGDRRRGASGVRRSDASGDRRRDATADRPRGVADRVHGGPTDPTRRSAADRFRRTSDRAFLGLVAELARTDRAS